MTRNLITKLVVVALAIASLGLASTAAAEEPVPNGATPVDPAAPAQPAQPVQPVQPAQPDQGVQAPDKAVDPVDKDMEPTAEEKALQERFDKECPQGGNSPGKFCKDFAAGLFNKRPPTTEEQEAFRKNCIPKVADADFAGFCKMYREGFFGCDEFVQHPKCKNGKGAGKGTGNGNGHYGEKGDGYDNGDYSSPVKKAEKVLNKQLPFTGLEIWQLGLLGLVLSGGGIGVRRLLAS